MSLIINDHVEFLNSFTDFYNTNRNMLLPHHPLQSKDYNGQKTRQLTGVDYISVGCQHWQHVHLMIIFIST